VAAAGAAPELVVEPALFPGLVRLPHVGSCDALIRPLIEVLVLVLVLVLVGELEIGGAVVVAMSVVGDDRGRWEKMRESETSWGISAKLAATPGGITNSGCSPSSTMMRRIGGVAKAAKRMASRNSSVEATLIVSPSSSRYCNGRSTDGAMSTDATMSDA